MDINIIALNQIHVKYFVDPMAIAYYRYERISQDIADFLEQILNG
jgi:hypothetical protein